ncbi:LysM peptidoglycan-binding domain-containing protein [Tepidibacillus fermentans]|uniref:LysM domain-containing protein n=1 Tax=Tepidibacillus fermentans TaxID=1281767 RepID=A0A4V2UT41_9BACI|nr:LysM peptidoglycan-binding domain-containing protein [Tepidibacillus fermentans]TCS84109.1 LysM domain-containing protein [Tepidibacillus fermentans]
MEQQIQQEEWFNHPLPPRSMVHRKVKTKKKIPSKIKKWNSLQIIVFLFIFLIIGTAYGVYQYGKTKDTIYQRESIHPPILQDSKETEANDNQSVDQSELKQEPQSMMNKSTESNPTFEQELNQPQEDSKPVEQNPDELKRDTPDQVIIHIVQPGETMFRISLKYYQTGSYADRLAKYNQINNLTKLPAGSTIKIPDKKELMKMK